MAETDDPDTEPVDDDSGRDFWNRRVYAFAVVWFLLQLPRLTLGPGLAGTAGSLFGAAIASLAVAGVLKGFYIVAKRGFAHLDPRSA